MAEENTQTTQETKELGGAQTAGGDPTSSTTTPAPAQAEKTFTQTEVNELIKARLERERKGAPTKEELTAFRDWQDKQKTTEQKAADDLKAANEARAAAEQKAADLEAKFAAIKAGVAPEAAEDVVALAMRKVSDTMPLSKAIGEVLKKYPQFCSGDALQAASAPSGALQTASVPATTGAKINNGGGTNISGVEKCFLDKNPGIKI